MTAPWPTPPGAGPRVAHGPCSGATAAGARRAGSSAATSFRTPKAVRRLVASEVADLDVEQNCGGRVSARPEAHSRVACDGPRPVLGQDPGLVPAPEHRMGGDHLAAVPHLQQSVAAANLHRRPGQRERHRVAVRVDAHEVVRRQHAGQWRVEPKRSACRCRHQRVTLPPEAIHRSLVRRPVHPHVGHRRRPLLQLLLTKGQGRRETAVRPGNFA